MKEPNPIKTDKVGTIIRFVYQDYLWVGNDEYRVAGYVKERDIKRLRNWCNKILAKQRRALK